jgi:hypothetical protein
MSGGNNEPTLGDELLQSTSFATSELFRTGDRTSLDQYAIAAKRRNLVDMIQEDFPRTPSPVIGVHRRSASGSSNNAFSASLDGTEHPIPKKNEADLSAILNPQFGEPINRSASPSAQLSHPRPQFRRFQDGRNSDDLIGGMQNMGLNDVSVPVTILES